MTDSRPERPTRTTPFGSRSLATIPGYLIRRSQQVHNAIWIEELGAELTGPQYAVLAALAARTGIDQRHLGALASLDKSSTADVVGRLESRLWIVRTRHPNDSRRNIIELSRAASLAFEHVTPVAHLIQRRLLEHLDPISRPAFIEQLLLVSRFGDTAGSALADHPPILELTAPGHLIRRAQQVHTSLWAEQFAGELTGPQYAALHVLSQRPGLNQRQLGELAALDKSTAADLLERLERRGWVVRRRDATISRGKIVFLSHEGETAIERLAPRVHIVQRRLLEPLASIESETFVAGLALIAFEGDIPEAAR